MHVWDKIHDTNDLSLLFKKKINKEIDKSKLSNVWAKIYNEYIIDFGLSENYKDIIELKREIAIKQAKFIATGDRLLLTFIGLDKENLKVLTKPKGKSINFKKNVTAIEKIQGIRIDPLKITVLEYFNYLKNLSNG